MIKVLLVEDDEFSSKFFYNNLKDNFEVKCAKNGVAGLDLYDRFKPDIIVTDISMPKMDGIEMASKIRLKDQNSKLIFLTSHDEVDYLLKSTELNITKYLIKPVSNDNLLEVIEKAISQIQKYEVVSKKYIYLTKDCFFDMENRTLTKNGDTISLSVKEKELLHFLCLNPNGVKSYDDIIYNLWPDEWDRDLRNALKTLVHSVKKKINMDNLTNVYGEGYKVISL